MKGYRFFLEYPSKTEKNKATVKNLGNHSGNCIAMILDENNRPLYNGAYNADCLSAIFSYPNSATNLCSVSDEYLKERCKRIPAHMVKDIHPMLWNRIID